MKAGKFRFRDAIEAMAGYVPGYQPAGTGVIKINTNENPYPPSGRVMAALRGVVEEQVRKYPPVMWDSFRAAAAKLHQVRPEQIVCGNGGDELLAMLVRCCCDYDRPLAYPTPTYSLYPVLAQIQGAPVIEVPFGTNYSLPEVLAKTGASLTIVCNPNAPSGTLVGRDALATLAEKLDGVLLVDEAYVDFAERDCLDLVREYENVAVLRSMSKGYSLAGMRFGYIVTSDRIAEAMIKVKDSYNVNIYAQAAATAAIEDQAYHRETVAKVIEQRERLTRELRELGFTVQDSQSNFVLAEIKKPAAKEIQQKLTDRNIYVRYFDLAGLRDKLRISVGTADQVDRLIAEITEIKKDNG
jgi:histidinol-phosphate aminotransferase